MDLDKSTLPGLEAGALRVPLEAAFKVVGLEELEGGARRSHARRPTCNVIHLPGQQ